MESLHVALAAVEAGAEPSKAAFYATGGALVAFALLVGAVGLASRDFPRSAGAARALGLLAVLLVAGTVVAAVATA